MSSTFVVDTTDDSSQANDTVIIIVNDDSGNISCADQEMLQQLLTSQEGNTSVSVVRVNETGGGSSSDINMTVEEIMNPSSTLLKANRVTKQADHNNIENLGTLLDLDKEDFEKIEYALQAEQAGQFFSAELEDLLDPELTGDPDEIENVTTVTLDHCYSAAKVVVRNVDSSLSSEMEYSSDGAPSSSGRTRGAGSPKRRSQRQIDRQEQEELRKIRAENEELLKKEKEVFTMQKKDSETETPAVEPLVTSEDVKQPVSRATTIRQKLQQDIMNVDPLPKSVKSVDPFEPKTGGKRQSDGVARPRRENRQPPKHLRDAFHQLEFEAATSIKKSPAASVLKQEEEPDSSLTNNKSSSISESPAKGETEEEEDVEDEEGEDEDGVGDEDPGKLWCVCREPHNNRFMICCDKCEDWFHGTCVGVTRAMGRQLEAKGLEWICPNCVRQEYAAKQQTPQDDLLDSPGKKKRKKEAAEKSAAANTRDPVVKLIDVVKENAANLDQKKNRVKRTSSSIVNSSSGAEAESESGSEKRKCVLQNCKSDARPNSVYCGDECIMVHARESLLAMSKLESASEKQQTAGSPSTPATPGKWKESLEFGELMSQPTPTSTKSKLLKKPANLADSAPVPVMERRTGKILTSSNAPKVAQLEQWLKEHPTYEVIKPSTLPAKNRTSVPVVRQNSASQPGTPTSSAPSPASSKTSGSASSKKPDRSKLPRKRSIETPKEDKKASQPDPESFRSVCKNALKEALWNRCKDEDDLSGKIDEAGAETIASEVEEALYRHFNKDVGQKYKSKYRSLVFNIKDGKNLGLFRQIAEKQITPGQLVKMTADELASKELAEWREREAKHQLDIIEKTELENMGMANKYLVKTHKGEEMIEGAANELALEADRSEVTSLVLGSEADGPNGPSSGGATLDLLQDTTERHKSHLFDLNCRICSGQTKPEDDIIKVSSKTSSSSDRKVNSDNKSSSSSKKKDSKDKERREIRDKKRSIDKGKDRRDSKEKDRTEKDKDRRGKERRHSSSSKSTTTKERSSNSRSHHHHKKHSEKDRRSNESKSVTTKEGSVHKPEETCVSQSSIENISDPIVSSAEATPSTQTVETPIAHPAKPDEEPSVVKQEPTSTVSIKTPEQTSSQSPPSPEPVKAVVATPSDLIVGWKGVINASEGKVNVQAHEISSGMSDLAELGLPPALDLVGRIRPEMVWDYVNQSRRAGSRDVIVFRIAPAADSDSSDRKMYSTYLGNLHKSNRFAVVGNVSKLIKDFYIVPLPKDSPVPVALTALSHNMKAFDENRTSQLLGVVVRIKRKRAGETTSSKPAKMSKTVTPVSSIKSSSITPPGSSTSSPTLNYIPTIRSSQKKVVGAAQPTTIIAADEIPYSPGQLLDDDEDSQNSPDVVMKPEEMLEELNRKIEDTKQELASALSAIAPEDAIPGLGEPVIPGLGGPSSIGTSSSSWKDTRVTPASDPPFERSASNPAASSLNLNLSNLQEIISTIQKKEEELKKTKEPVKMDQLPTELFSPSGDVDMRIIPPVIAAVPVEKKKNSLLNQMTDEELLAKAMEMEMEQSAPPPISTPVVPAPIQQPVQQQGPSFYPPYGGGPPHPPGMMGSGQVPMPPMAGMMMNPPRPPFYSSPPYHTTSPPFRGRNNR